MALLICIFSVTSSAYAVVASAMTRVTFSSSALLIHLLVRVHLGLPLSQCGFLTLLWRCCQYESMNAPCGDKCDPDSMIGNLP
ncbi:hypothetical protein TIFTF001_042927 [Ficus carica]|uniref:Secreted protein n=1 Tax=Ficus carica TaxID=3494 RepID=A0AA88CVK2_FICCA|nr:hypothetical protein TIFTF001_042927 [Ficus carica]